MLSELSQKGKENKTTKKPIRVLHVGNRQPSFLLSCPEWLHGGWGESESSLPRAKMSL